MPRIPKHEAHEQMKRLILGYDLTAQKLATIWGCSPNTARAKRDDPGKITLSEVRELNIKGHIPIEELREAIKW